MDSVKDLKIQENDFVRIGTEGISAEKLGKPALTYWADVWRRFRNNKLALLGLIILILE